MTALVIAGSASGTVTIEAPQHAGDTVLTLPSWSGELSGCPKGTIVLWNAGTGPVPEGWVLCDGTNQSPDLTQVSVYPSNFNLQHIMKV